MGLQHVLLGFKLIPQAIGVRFELNFIVFLEILLESLEAYRLWAGIEFIIGS
jgi:hypothetical protein